ncbi:MAG: hypothetical protein QOH63_1969 [Acidobacteriota bacterium]|jgi:hypothetical protein|nr:hypothetical protein [Acidobacteriota bacterium]
MAEPIILEEIGRTGLNQSGGYIYEDNTPEWKGLFKTRTIRRMLTNAICGAILFAVEMLIRQTEFTVKSASEENKDKEAADFIDSCHSDMSTAWPDLVAEILTMLPWGWSWFEECYKERRGDNPGTYKDSSGVEKQLPQSNFNDGKIGWRKWAIRSQESLLRWQFDDEGGISALVQLPPPDFKTRVIPIEKSLLFRTTVHKGNPEGESIFRRGYEAYYYMKNIARIEAIGIERDLAGIPELWVPPNIANPKTDDDRAAKAAWIKVGQNVRNDEQACLMFPLVYDNNHNKLYDFKLSGTNSRRLIDTSTVIDRYKHDLLITTLSDFLILGAGSSGRGSYALSADKTELFSTVIGAWMDSICGVVNRHAIPRLLKLNGYSTERVPTLEHGKIDQIDLASFGTFIVNAAQAGIVFTDEQVNYILQQVDDSFPVNEIVSQPTAPQAKPLVQPVPSNPNEA